MSPSKAAQGLKLRRKSAADRQRALKEISDSKLKRKSSTPIAIIRANSSRRRAGNDTSNSDEQSKRIRTSRKTSTSNTRSKDENCDSDSTDSGTTATLSAMNKDAGTTTLQGRRTSPATPTRSTADIPRANIVPPRDDPNPTSPSTSPQKVTSDKRITLSLEERRRIRKTNVISHKDISECGSTDGGSSTLSSPIQFNRMKAQLAEAISEKRTMKAALDLANDKCKSQDIDIRKLSQQVEALENMINKPSTKGRRSSKKGTWNKDDENSVIAPYKGIRLQLDIIVNAEAALVVTESVFSTSSNVRMQNWTSSSTPINCSSEEAPALSVKYPDGTVAIPNCAMLRCFYKKFYIDRFVSTAAFVRHITTKILDESMSFGMSDEEKDDCMAKMSSYPPVISKCRTALREETNNAKQGARNIFLKLLCYRKAHLGEDKKNKRHNDDRIKEKKMVYERCVRKTSDSKTDTMHWRTTSYALLYNSETDEQETVDRMLALEDGTNSDCKVDNLFMNEPAKVAFTRMRGYSISEDASEDEKDASIILVARADAWMTTVLANIRGVGKGGMHSNEYVQSYENLLPRALEVIIKEVWDDLCALSPEEVCVSIPESEKEDPYGNKIRQWTFVLKSPDDNYLYLLVTPKYVAENVCSWIGNIKDCQIGRCKPNDEKFTRITEGTDFTDLEESDIEEEEIEIDSQEDDVLNRMNSQSEDGTRDKSANLGDQHASTVQAE